MRRKIVLFLGAIVVLLAGISLGLQLQNSSTQQTITQLVATQENPNIASVMGVSPTMRSWSSELEGEDLGGADSSAAESDNALFSDPDRPSKIPDLLPNESGSPRSVVPTTVTPSLSANTARKPAESQTAMPAKTSEPVATPQSPSRPAEPSKTEEKSSASKSVAPTAKPSTSNKSVVSPSVSNKENNAPVKNHTPLQKPAPNPASTTNQTRINNQMGANFSVDLAERGWVLITDVTGRLQIVERVNLPNNVTRYTFKSIAVGSHRLEFSRQLTNQAGYEKRTIEVIVTPSKVESVISSPTSSTPAAAETVKAESSSTKVALPATKPQVVTPKPAKQAVPSTIVQEKEEQAESEDFLPEIIHSATKAGDLVPHAQSLRDGKNSLERDTLKQAFDLLWDEKLYYLLASELGETFVARFKSDLMSAEVLYRLGRIFEIQGQERDLLRSYGYYQRVFEEYPITPYSRLSKERMDYLDRFFFQIQ